MQRDPGADDEVLVRQVALGSETALATLYDRHGGTVLRTARRLGADHGTAEEVVQATFLALWDHAHRFDPSAGSLPAWLATVARNHTINRHRASARRVQGTPLSAFAGEVDDPNDRLDWLLWSGGASTSAAAEPSPEAVVAAAEVDADIALALAALTPDERTAIILAYRDELTQAEIAERLGWPLGTVKTRSRRALRRLREALASRSGEPDPDGPRHADDGRVAPGSAVHDDARDPTPSPAVYRSVAKLAPATERCH